MRKSFSFHLNLPCRIYTDVSHEPHLFLASRHNRYKQSLGDELAQVSSRRSMHFWGWQFGFVHAEDYTILLLDSYTKEIGWAWLLESGSPCATESPIYSWNSRTHNLQELSFAFVNSQNRNHSKLFQQMEEVTSKRFQLQKLHPGTLPMASSASNAYYQFW